jgi:hypothetical protein
VTIGRAGPVVCAGGILLSLSGLSPRPARAAPLTVTLEYAAPAGCPDASELKAVVAARLGRDPFGETAPEHVLVRIESRGRAMDGRIEWRDSNERWTGDQSFPAVNADCGHLVRTMGFALAVQIQFLASASTSAPDTPPAPVPEATTAPTAPVVPDAPHSPTGRRGPVFAAGTGPAVGFGISSAPVLLGRIFGAVAWSHVSFELAAAVSVPATIRRADGAGFSQQHLLGSAAACANLARWRSCLLGNAGEIRMSGQDIDRATSASAALVQVGARSGIDQPLSRRIYLNAYADGLINLTRWTGRLDRVPVWTAPRFAATLGVGVGLQFP